MDQVSSGLSKLQRFYRHFHQGCDCIGKFVMLLSVFYLNSQLLFIQNNMDPDKRLNLIEYLLLNDTYITKVSYEVKPRINASVLEPGTRLGSFAAVILV